MNSQGQYQLVFGDSSKMDILRTGEVDLVLTGPPYFSDTTEGLLREPFRKQKDIERAKREGRRIGGRKRKVTRDAVAELKARGLGASAIARELGCDKTAVYRAHPDGWGPSPIGG